MPIYLCQRDLILSAIATDVNAGPVKNAEENIALHGLENKISARIGDGMEELDPLEYDTVSVCGMGGELIFRIINNEKVKRFRPKLILQPMSSIQDLSYLMAEHGFRIYDDLWIKDAGHIYRIMCVEYSGAPYTVTSLEAYVGAINLQRRDEVTLLYVERLKEQTEYKIKAKTQGASCDVSQDVALLEMINDYLSGGIR
ncbi:MAG: SAM-dependent methyltransferase [Clostridia bacterium]|nr:SAM-dependent methyltransferase [Clostridia bacterium]